MTTTKRNGPPTAAKFRAWLTRLEDLEELAHRRLTRVEVVEIESLRALVERWQFRTSEWVSEVTDVSGLSDDELVAMVAGTGAAAARLVQRGILRGHAGAMEAMNADGVFSDLVAAVHGLARGDDLGGGILEMMARRLLDAARSPVGVARMGFVTLVVDSDGVVFGHTYTVDGIRGVSADGVLTSGTVLLRDLPSDHPIVYMGPPSPPPLDVTAEELDADWLPEVLRRLAARDADGAGA